MGHQKILGRDLMVAIVAGEGERQRDVYLPAGDWADVHTNDRISSTGQWIEDVPLWRNGASTLPAYARSGAVIQRRSSMPRRKTSRASGRTRPCTTSSSKPFTPTTAPATSPLRTEGATTAYESGTVRTTQISQATSGGTASVTVGASSGTYTGAPSSRPTVVELVTDGSQASAATLGGSALTHRANKAAFDAATSVCYNAGGGLVVAKAATSAVTSAKTFSFTPGQDASWATFACENATTTSGQSVYVGGAFRSWAIGRQPAR